MSDSNLDAIYYDELWEQIREHGASTPSPPAAVQQLLGQLSQTGISTGTASYYAREYNPFEEQFGQALEANSPRDFEPPPPFLTPAARGIPAGSSPDANPAATAAVSPVVPQAVARATIPAPSQQTRRNDSQNTRRRRQEGLWRLYSSFATVFAETENSRSRREAWARRLNNMRQIFSVDNEDPQQNPGEASGTQYGTSGNSSDGRAVRSLLTPDEGEEEDELCFPQYGF